MHWPSIHLKVILLIPIPHVSGSFCLLPSGSSFCLSFGRQRGIRLRQQTSTEAVGERPERKEAGAYEASRNKET